MKETVVAFLEKRKEDRIKKKEKEKKLKDKKDDDDESKAIRDEIKQSACDEFFYKEWIPKAAKRANQLTLIRHNPKMTHAAAKITPFEVSATHDNDGFLRTGNAEYDYDVYGNAAALDVFSFLNLRDENGSSILNFIETDSLWFYNHFDFSKEESKDLCKQFLSVKSQGEEVLTSDLVKQVYFPVGGDYHLLSILMPSGLMFNLKKRIDDIRFSQKSKDLRSLRNKNEFSDETFDEIYNLTVIGFGGTKPQNIGNINKDNGGKMTLLESLPPTLNKNVKRPPRNDFFENCLYYKNFEDLFKSIDKIRSQEYTNKAIKDGIKDLYWVIIDKIIKKSWEIQSYDGGWSKNDRCKSLPSYQKIWLDSERLEEKSENDDWKTEVSHAMARWIVKKYEKQRDKKGPLMGDAEFRNIVSLIEKGRVLA